MKKRKNHEARVRHVEGWLGERWFEIVDAMPPERFAKLDLPFLKDHRVFVRGRIKDITVVEVPSGMPRELVTKMGEQLAESGITALIVSDAVKFMNLRALTDEEEELFREQKPQASQVTIPRSPATAGDTDVYGDGSERQRSGNGGGEPQSGTTLLGDGEAGEDN